MQKMNVLIPWEDDSNYLEFDEYKTNESALLVKLGVAGLTFLMFVIYMIP